MVQCEVSGRGVDVAMARTDNQYEVPPHALFIDPPDDARVDTLALEIESRSIEWAPTLEMQKAAKFFRTLDLSTNPQLSKRPRFARGVLEQEQSFRDALMSVATRALWIRMGGRAVGEHYEDANLTPARVGYLSGLQLGCLRDCGYKIDQPEMHRVWYAYSSFAAGDMRMSMDSENPYKHRFVNGEPNSALVFCFAEFALTAIEADIDAAKWEILLPALIAMQEVYLQSYGEPRGVGFKPQSTNFYDGRGPWEYASTIDRVGIWSSYQRKGVKELEAMFVDNLKRAFTGFGATPKMGHV